MLCVEHDRLISLQRSTYSSERRKRINLVHRHRHSSFRARKKSQACSADGCFSVNHTQWRRRQALVLLGTAASLWQPCFATAQLADTQTVSETPARTLTPEERAAVQRALQKAATKTKAPVLLRLAFHDAGTFLEAAGNGGANASIRFELKRPENTGLNRGWTLIEAAKKNVEGTPASWLSNADIIALAGAYAVELCGGPVIDVPVGRVDATAQDPTGRLPEESLSAAQLRQAFSDKGLSTRELVALSGAHTLGNKGFGDPLTFDNTYYTTLLKRPWTNSKDSMASMIGLPSDHVLPDDPECADVIEGYASSLSSFFRDFSQSYLKLTSLGAHWV